MLGVEVIDQPVQHRHSLLTFFMVQPGRVITTYAMLVTDGATVRHNGLTGCLLQHPPDT